MNAIISKADISPGDCGITMLSNNKSINKTHARVTAIGDVGELNSWIGKLASSINIGGMQDGFAPVLLSIQHDLFNLERELSNPGLESAKFSENKVKYLEGVQSALIVKLPVLQGTVLPRGHREASDAFLAQSVARRAERSVWALNYITDEEFISALFNGQPSDTEHSHKECARYLNRLSGFLLAYGRTINHEAKIAETIAY